MFLFQKSQQLSQHGKKLGNKYYQFVPSLDEFRERCRDTDIDGFNFIFSDNDKTSENTQFSDEQGVRISSSNEEENSSEDDIETEEKEYQSKDSVKRWQFDYNKST